MVNPKSLKNLITARDRTPEERREMGRRGGIRSGEVRKVQKPQRREPDLSQPTLKTYQYLLKKYRGLTDEERKEYPRSYEMLLLEKIADLEAE